jgi:2'-5' RNA ligase
MPRLFVAVDLPAVTIAELIRIQPLPNPWIRRVEADQMHLTLHYLGEVEAQRAQRMADALTRSIVEVPTFSLSLAGVGQFSSVGGATTVWAGVRDSAELRQLHATVAEALAGEGFQPEARSYTPHITLARCGPEVTAGMVREFLACHQDFLLADVPIERVSLCSSILRDTGPVYQREHALPLRSIGT